MLSIRIDPTQRQLMGHQNHVVALDSSPSGRFVLSGCADGTAKLWQFDSGANVRSLEDATTAVVAASFHGEQSCIVLYADGRMDVWVTATGKCQTTHSVAAGDANVGAVSPSGQYLCCAASNGRIHVWDLHGPKRLLKADHGGRVGSVAITADARYAVSSGGDDGTTKIWEISSGEMLHKVEVDSTGVTTLCVSPTKPLLAAATAAGTIRLLNYQNGSPVGSLEGHQGNVRALVFLPDGQTLISGSDDRTLRFWDVESLQCIAERGGFDAAVKALAASQDGSMLLIGSGNNIDVWQLTPEETQSSSAHRAEEDSEAFELDGIFGEGLPSDSPNGGLQLWESGESARPDEVSEGDAYELRPTDDLAVPPTDVPVDAEVESVQMPPPAPPASAVAEETFIDRARGIIGQLHFELSIGAGALLAGILLCLPRVPTFLSIVLILGALAWTSYCVYRVLSAPKRDTPEEALRQYFGVPGQPLANYGHMYACLAEKAQRVPEFATVAAFRAYWKYHLRRIRPETAGWGPLVTRIANLQIDHGNNAKGAKASFTLAFSMRGKQKPATEFRMKTTLVKGVDELWYLEDGRLPITQDDDQPVPAHEIG